MRVRRASHVCIGVVGDRTVLFSTRDRAPHLLNETAALVWSLTAEPVEPSVMVDTVARRHGVAVAAVRGDVLEMLDSLLDAGLCVDAGASTAPSDMVPRPRPARRRPAGPGGLTIDALGTTLMLSFGPGLERLGRDLASITETLRTGSTPGGPVRTIHVRLEPDAASPWRIELDGDTAATARTEAECRRRVLSMIDSVPLDDLTDSVVLHAAAVEIDGRAVVLPGESDAGKSTLAAQLVERGHSYLTDEAAAVDVRSLEVQPHPKALTIDRGAHRLLADLAPPIAPELADHRWDVDPRRIGPGRLGLGGTVRAIVFPRYRRSIRNPVVRRLEPLDALLGLLATSFDFGAIGQPAFDALVRLSTQVPAHELVHSGHAHLPVVEALGRGVRDGSPGDRRRRGAVRPE